MTYLLLCFGLALLVGGGELLVRGSIAVATHLKLSPLLIGLTLVGFGTSMPELVTSVELSLNPALIWAFVQLWYSLVLRSQYWAQSF